MPSQNIRSGWTLLFVGFILSACAPLVPATTPPQLEHTPGAFVVVTHETFDAGEFVVDYPSSWRVVKTSIAAAEHIQIVFVAPDESTITLTDVDDVNDTPDENEQFITLDNAVIVQALIDPTEDADAMFFEQADNLINSIRME